MRNISRAAVLLVGDDVHFQNTDPELFLQTVGV